MLLVELGDRLDLVRVADRLQFLVIAFARTVEHLQVVDVPQGTKQPHARVEPLDSRRVGQQHVRQLAKRLQVPSHVQDVAVGDRRNLAAFLAEFDPGADVEVHADGDQSVGLQLADLVERGRHVGHALGEYAEVDAILGRSVLHDLVQQLLRLGQFLGRRRRPNAPAAGLLAEVDHGDPRLAGRRGLGRQQGSGGMHQIQLRGDRGRAGDLEKTPAVGRARGTSRTGDRGHGNDDLDPDCRSASRFLFGHGGLLEASAEMTCRQQAAGAKDSLFRFPY